jgi:glycosyltransferase involved in cell wall biosynthesis
MHRVTFIADIVTPYMTAVLRALEPLCHLTPLFCAARGSRGFAWKLDGLPRHAQVLDGFVIRSVDRELPDYYPSPRLLAAIARSRPDVVLSSAYSFPSLYAAAYAMLFRARLIIYCDGTAHSERNINVVQRASRRLLARMSHAAAAKSRLAADRFVQLGWRPESVFLTPHSTELGALHEVARQRHYGTGSTLTLLSVGRLIPKKGVHLLIHAAAQARRAGTQVQLVIAGSGTMESALHVLSRHLDVPVTWHGFVDQDRLPALYAQADAFAFPSLSEPFGVALLEAAAAGLPCIASPYAGASRDLVDGQGSGLVVDPRDTGAFADAIGRLAREPAERERMGRAAHRLTLGRTPEATAREYMRAVEAVLAHD